MSTHNSQLSQGSQQHRHNPQSQQQPIQHVNPLAPIVTIVNSLQAPAQRVDDTIIQIEAHQIFTSPNFILFGDNDHPHVNNSAILINRENAVGRFNVSQGLNRTIDIGNSTIGTTQEAIDNAPRTRGRFLVHESIISQSGNNQTLMSAASHSADDIGVFQQPSSNDENHAQQNVQAQPQNDSRSLIENAPNQASTQRENESSFQDPHQRSHIGIEEFKSAVQQTQNRTNGFTRGHIQFENLSPTSENDNIAQKQQDQSHNGSSKESSLKKNIINQNPIQQTPSKSKQYLKVQLNTLSAHLNASNELQISTSNRGTQNINKEVFISNSKSKSYTAARHTKDRFSPDNSAFYLKQMGKIGSSNIDSNNSSLIENAKMTLNFADEDAGAKIDEENNHADKEDNVGNGNNDEEEDEEERDFDEKQDLIGPSIKTNNSEYGQQSNRSYQVLGVEIIYENKNDQTDRNSNEELNGNDQNMQLIDEESKKDDMENEADGENNDCNGEDDESQLSLKGKPHQQVNLDLNIQLQIDDEQNVKQESQGIQLDDDHYFFQGSNNIENRELEFQHSDSLGKQDEEENRMTEIPLMGAHKLVSYQKSSGQLDQQYSSKQFSSHKNEFETDRSQKDYDSPGEQSNSYLDMSLIYNSRKNPQLEIKINGLKQLLIGSRMAIFITGQKVSESLSLKNSHGSQKTPSTSSLMTHKLNKMKSRFFILSQCIHSPISVMSSIIDPSVLGNFSQYSLQLDFSESGYKYTWAITLNEDSYLKFCQRKLDQINRTRSQPIEMRNLIFIFLRRISQNLTKTLKIESETYANRKSLYKNRFTTRNINTQNTIQSQKRNSFNASFEPLTIQDGKTLQQRQVQILLKQGQDDDREMNEQESLVNDSKRLINIQNQSQEYDRQGIDLDKEDSVVDEDLQEPIKASAARQNSPTFLGLKGEIDNEGNEDEINVFDDNGSSNGMNSLNQNRPLKLRLDSDAPQDLMLTNSLGVIIDENTQNLEIEQDPQLLNNNSAKESAKFGISRKKSNQTSESEQLKSNQNHYLSNNFHNNSIKSLNHQKKPNTPSRKDANQNDSNLKNLHPYKSASSKSTQQRHKTHSESERGESMTSMKDIVPERNQNQKKINGSQIQSKQLEYNKKSYEQLNTSLHHTYPKHGATLDNKMGLDHQSNSSLNDEKQESSQNNSPKNSQERKRTKKLADTENGKVQNNQRQQFSSAVKGQHITFSDNRGTSPEKIQKLQRSILKPVKLDSASLRESNNHNNSSMLHQEPLLLGTTPQAQQMHFQQSLNPFQMPLFQSGQSPLVNQKRYQNPYEGQSIQQFAINPQRMMLDSAKQQMHQTTLGVPIEENSNDQINTSREYRARLSNIATTNKKKNQLEELSQSEDEMHKQETSFREDKKTKKKTSKQSKHNKQRKERNKNEDNFEAHRFYNDRHAHGFNNHNDYSAFGSRMASKSSQVRPYNHDSMLCMGCQTHNFAVQSQLIDLCKQQTQMFTVFSQSMAQTVKNLLDHQNDQYYARRKRNHHHHRQQTHSQTSNDEDAFIGREEDVVSQSRESGSQSNSSQDDSGNAALSSSDQDESSNNRSPISVENGNLHIGIQQNIRHQQSIVEEDDYSQRIENHEQNLFEGLRRDRHTLKKQKVSQREQRTSAPIDQSAIIQQMQKTIQSLQKQLIKERKSRKSSNK